LVLVCLLCLGVVVSDQVYCVIRGWWLLLSGVDKSCGALRNWLMGYCIALTMLPFWFGVAGPLIIWWAINGNLIRSRLPAACKESSPALWSFIDEVFVSSFLTCGCMVLAAALLFCVRLRAARLHRIWGTAGPAAEDVINSILAEPAPEVPPGAECTICLDEGTPQTRWRSLRCGHHFHEACLLEWLRRARRCPLCRLDLHVAYIAGDETPEVEAGASGA